uniref:PDZ domain-containing protein n=1 Tax=Callorhinchus milii TaxID=7868 RepID=A0A4W3GLJ7_CALMI
IPHPNNPTECLISAPLPNVPPTLPRSVRALLSLSRHRVCAGALSLSLSLPPIPAPPLPNSRLPSFLAAQTPIEEFTPTPAFPALQYLESVDEGGVAWRAGLRMGDFLIEVNGQNVVKVGHRQVVNMIRQGGNNLMLKVVMVTRNPDMEEATRKKGQGSRLSSHPRRRRR